MNYLFEQILGAGVSSSDNVVGKIVSEDSKQ